jgi:hypothetical protein
MKKSRKCLFNLIICAGLTACASGGRRAAMHYDHGSTIPDQYISVVGYTANEIEFKIAAKFPLKHAYHLVLDGDTPLAEGWYPASRPESNFYTVKLKAKKGVSFQVGKPYRLCVGAESPEFIAVHSSNYRCIIDFEFVLGDEKLRPPLG